MQEITREPTTANILLLYEVVKGYRSSPSVQLSHSECTGILQLRCLEQSKRETAGGSGKTPFSWPIMGPMEFQDDADLVRVQMEAYCRKLVSKKLT